jgi:hypothetical protein
MKTIHVLLSLILVFSVTANAQTFEWAKSFGGNNYVKSNSISTDALGNVYTTGYFEGTVDFDPGIGVELLSTQGSDDIFVQKLDDSGNLLWVKSFGGNSADQSSSIIVTPSGSIYITGRFRETVDFDPGIGTEYLTAQGEDDVFVLKLDQLGNFVWAKSLGGGSLEQSNSIAVGPFGNLCITGCFQGTVDFDPGTGTEYLSAIGALDVFVQKMDTSGQFVWAKSFGGSFDDQSNSVTIDPLGNILTTGWFWETVDFNPGIATEELTSQGANDIFVHKFDASGNFMWVKSFGSSSYDKGFSIAVNASGSIYTTGSFRETVDFDPGAGTEILTSHGEDDVFVQKLTPLGDFLWAKSFGGGSTDRSSSVTIDPSGNIITTGWFFGTSDFNSGTGTENLTSLGGNDVFVHKLDALGNFVWAKSFGGSFSDLGRSVTVDPSGNILTTGWFWGTVDFNPDMGTEYLTAQGVYDAFIQKIGQPFLNSETNGNVSKTSSVSIIPNPSNSFVKVLFEEGEANLTILDLNGKLIREVMIASGDYVDISSFLNGVYLFKLESVNPGSTVIRRVMKN